MQRKARAGHVTGGRVFGYDNVEVCGADGQRSHVERRINEAEATVVRRIFELCAAGVGLTRITKQLNAERVPAPRAQQGRPVAWAPSSLDALPERLRGRQARRQELEALLAGHQTLAAPVAGARLEQRLRAKLADWRGLLTHNVESARDVLRALLAGPLRFTPIDETRRCGYAFDGSIALDRLLSGVIELVPRTGVASPTGTVNRWRPAFDGISNLNLA